MFSKSSTILIVDDEVDVGEAIKSYVESFGEPTIHLATGGDEAYNFATRQIREKKKIDLIITDYRMGKTSGLDFLKKVRKNDFLKNCPVLMVSAYLSEDLVREAAALKGVHFVVKPLSQDLLKEKIERLMQATRDIN